MALYYDLPVYRDTYKLILKIFECTKDFSKEYKYTLGQDMKRDALQLVRSIYRANKSTNKMEHLEAFMDDFELLKIEIRLCVDMKILTINGLRACDRNPVLRLRQGYGACTLLPAVFLYISSYTSSLSKKPNSSICGKILFASCSFALPNSFSSSVAKLCSVKQRLI